MNNIFGKSALAMGLAAAGLYSEASFAASATAVSGDVVVIGCAAPSSGTSGGTVYTVDAISSTSNSLYTYTISLPSTVAAGQSCSYAIQQLTKTTAVSTSSIYFEPVSPALGVQTANDYATAEQFYIPGTGYGITLNTFQAGGTLNPQNGILVGCTAGTPTAGSTVYSIDLGILVNEAEHAINTTALVGKPCSQALGALTSGSNVGGSTGTYSNVALTLQGQTEVVIPNVGYGLNLYTLQ